MSDDEHQADLERIQKQMAEEEARRPHGKDQRCFDCAYWQLTAHHKARHKDDHQGECHRRAPVITLHYQHIAEALGLIAWAAEEAANVEHRSDAHFDYAFESEETPTMTWPRTYGSSWCGEFEKTEKPLTCGE
jgi:hypothetical protein